MDMQKEKYKNYVKAHAPRSPLLFDCLHAFLVGGIICTLAQGIRMLLTDLCHLETQTASSTVSVILIFLAVLLTGLGVFDKIAKYAGAGTLVPITGFANAVVSPAIDSRAEGWILGVGAKIFTVAGPVLLYGILSGAIYGVIYFIYLLLS